MEAIIVKPNHKNWALKLLFDAKDITGRLKECLT